MAELVGILNLTPDSFSDGGQYNNPESSLRHASNLFSQGASIVDVGAESTRPGAQALSWQEEVSRLSDLIPQAAREDWQISLDSYHPETISWASQILAKFIINDVSGFRSPVMREVAAESDNRLIVSHLPQTSLSLQDAHEQRSVDSVEQVVDELSHSVEQLIEAGVSRHKIIVDPGIGFGKSRALNWELLQFGKEMPSHQVMIGYSRKRFLGERRMELATNLLAGSIALEACAQYLRVHDVAGHAVLI